MRYLQNITHQNLPRKIIYTCVFSGILLTGSIASAASILPLAEGCTTCHGAKGAGSGAIPPIHGKPQDVFIAQMQAFKTSLDGTTIMPRFVSGLTDAEIAALAAWFEEQGK